MNFFSYFVSSKPPIFNLNGKESKDLSNHDFKPQERNYLCDFYHAFGLTVEKICKRFNIKVKTFQKWLERTKAISSMDAMDILAMTSNDNGTIQKPTVEASTQADSSFDEFLPASTFTQTQKQSQNASQNMSQKANQNQNQTSSSTYTQRRKPFEDFCPRHKRNVVEEANDAALALPMLQGFSQADKEVILSTAFSQKDAARHSSTVILKQLLANFKAALEAAIKKKNSDLIVQLLSLLYQTYTKLELEASIGLKITKYYWNKAHRHWVAFDVGGIATVGGIVRYRYVWKQSNLTLSPMAIDQAVGWLFSEKIFKSVAHGTHVLHNSSAERITLPTYYRYYRTKEVWRRYCLSAVQDRW